MTPEQLIAEVEALDKSATHGPWIAGELGTNDAGGVQADQDNVFPVVEGVMAGGHDYRASSRPNKSCCSAPFP
jgi:hypothetical protein